MKRIRSIIDAFIFKLVQEGGSSFLKQLMFTYLFNNLNQQ